MTKKLTCQQIDALICFYADGTLHNLLKKSVKDHIDNCPICMQKYLNIAENLMSNNKQTETLITNNQYETKQYEQFKKNLSAYIDNELDDNENIKIKKFTISNPLARQDLEEMLAFKKLLHLSFEKTKNDIKTDFAKKITEKFQKEMQINTVEPFYKIAVIFLIMLSILIIGFIKILNF